MPRSKIEQNLSNIRQGLNVAAPAFTGGEPVLDAAAEEEEHQSQSDPELNSAISKVETDWKAITSNLAQRIDNAKQQINLLQKEIKVSQNRLQESEEAYDLVMNPPKWEPSAEQFELFHQLKTVVAQQESEEDRLKKLGQIQQALNLGRQVILQKEKQIVLLEAELRNLQDELTWATKYAPFVLRFEPGYQYPQPQRREIERHVQYLWDAQKLLREAEENSRQSPEKVQRWIAGTIYDSPEKAIATYRQSVENQQQQIEVASRRNEKHFRAYIIARVDADPLLQDFIQVQESYRKALGRFVEALQTHSTSLGLSLEETGKIINLKLPSIKMDGNGRISVV